MSSSDTDEELNVAQYDVEDDLNAYGSPVHRTGAAVNALSVLPAPIHSRTHVMFKVICCFYTCGVRFHEMKFVSFQFCNCKNTCSRHSGRKKRGCPCRDEGLKCTDDCTCGTKKAACNNKQETVAVSVAGASAFERHQITVDEAKGHITVGVFF